MHLEFPNILHKNAYLDLIAEWEQAEVTPTSPHILFGHATYEDFLQAAIDDIPGLPGRVPAHIFFLLENERILGAIQIRHHIDHPNLKEFGGHIGYGVRPSERRKGYATEMLRLCLIEAKKLGLKQVLISCYDDNIASRKVIEKNGGVLERYTEKDGKKARRYWVNLGE